MDEEGYVVTVADKIRNMSDEELAKLLDDAESAGYNDSSIAPKNEHGYSIDMLEWLKSKCDKENENKVKKIVPGIFCLNTNCKHYFEDNCMKFFEKSTLNISVDGRCENFENGENEVYKHC